MLRDMTIGQFYPAESVIHRLDPRVKVVGVLAYLISLFLFRGFFPKWVEINHVIAGSTCKKGASYVQGNRN